MKKMTTYHMDGSMSVAIPEDKRAIKLSSDYDGRDQASLRLTFRCPHLGEGKKADLVILDKDVYKKSSSKWVKSAHSGNGVGQADALEIIASLARY